MISNLKEAAPQIHPAAFVHESAQVIGKVKIGADASVWPQAVLRGDIEEITVGEGSNIQDGAVAHTDYGLPTIIGKGVVVGHGVILHGCTIGNNCLIGMGAIVLNGAVIGDECLIAAGCLVKERDQIPPRSLVVGLPGKIARPLNDQEVEKIKHGAAEYIEFARRFKAEQK